MRGVQCGGTRRKAKLETRNQKLEMGKAKKRHDPDRSPRQGPGRVGRAFEFGFLVPRAWSARAAERGLRGVNQGAQGRIDGLLVREILSDVR